MREIKFRAWYKKKMLYDITDLSYINGSNGFELMQFTGLKDKNGKEIYEGDIVKFCSWNDCQTNPERQWHEGVEIYWNEGEARFDGEGFIMGMIYASFQYEVIGNIYENPELLK